MTRVFYGIQTGMRTAKLGRQVYPNYETKGAWRERNQPYAEADFDVGVDSGQPIRYSGDDHARAIATWDLATGVGTYEEEQLTVPIPPAELGNPTGRYEALAGEVEHWLGRGGMTVVIFENSRTPGFVE